MPAINRNKSLTIWLSNYLNLKPLQSVINICLILLGPILAVATYLFLGPFNVAGQSAWLRFVLLLDLIYVLLIVGIVLVRILYVLSQRRSRLAGSKLHFRLASVFTTMSLLPTITVAVFATISINLGLEVPYITNLINTACMLLDSDFRLKYEGIIPAWKGMS